MHLSIFFTENESLFLTRTVEINRGTNPEEKYELIRELGRYDMAWDLLHNHPPVI